MTASCEIPRADIGEIAESIKTEISARVLNGAPVVPLSTEDILAYVFAGASFEVSGVADAIMRESNVETMCCDNLVKWAARRNVFLLSADRARGFVNVTGTPGTAIPSTLYFMYNTLQYDMDVAFDNPTVIGDNGVAVVRVVAHETGIAHNIPVGSTLVLGTTILNVNGSAIATSDIAGGSVDEDCESLRSRIIAIRKRGAVSVNSEWFIEQTYKYPGVTKVCIDECNCCDSGWVVVYPFFAQTFPPYGVPNSTILEDMTKWMFGARNGSGGGLAPIGVKGYYSCATPTYINIIIHGAVGVDSTMRTKIAEAMDKFFLEKSCPGGQVCKKDIDDIVRSVLSASCWSNITFSFDTFMVTEDDKFLSMKCGVFPVAGTVKVSA